jgi:hypothetical protein
MGKQVSMRAKIAQHLRFHIPSFTFADQAHRHQLAITAKRFRPRSFELWDQPFADVIHNAENVQAKIIETVYHWSVLLFGWLVFEQPQSYRRMFFLLIGSSIRPY